MKFGLPFIYEYSAKIQIAVLVALILASYLDRRARFTIGGLIAIHLAFKILLPFVTEIIYLFKAFAMFAFYIYFFKIGVGYALSTVNYVSTDGIAAVVNVLKARDATANKQESP